MKERIFEINSINFETLPVDFLTLPSNWKQITKEDSFSTHIQVIVPAHNEEIIIGRILNNLTSQIIPTSAKLTIDVISNGTTDNTELKVKKAQEELKFKIEKGILPKEVEIRFFSIEKASKSAAVNYGKVHAVSDILINVDADTLPTSNSLSKIYALMRHYPDCMAASIMPKRAKNNKGSATLHNFQDYYDSFTRENGAILGKFYAYRNGVLEDIPENIMSDDTWLEFTCLDRYGQKSVRFLGQSQDTDVAIEYSSTTKMTEYLFQLLRWESSFQHLMKIYPHLEKACKMANRVEQPEKAIDVIKYMKDKYPQIPIIDKLGMYYLLRTIRKITTIEAVSEKFGNRTNWVSPKSDRVDINY